MRTTVGRAGRHGNDDDCGYDGRGFVRWRAFKACEDGRGLVTVSPGRNGDVEETGRVMDAVLSSTNVPEQPDER
jgi:hypothetical protein